MKLFGIVAVILLFVLPSLQAQHNAFSIEMLRFRAKNQPLCSEPIDLMGGKRALLSPTRQLDLLVAASYRKNTLPAVNLDGGVAKNYHLSLPIYANLQINPSFGLETGIYLGIAGTGLQAIGAAEFPLLIDQSIQLDFDSGLMTGFSADIGELSKLSLRYHHGFSNITFFDGRQSVRRIDVGLTIVL